MERKVYVLMWLEARGESRSLPAHRAGAMFATTTRKRLALQRGRELQADVYAIPAPGVGWDCPTIRATFDPIMRKGIS